MIHVEFTDLDDMMNFARQLAGMGQAAPKAEVLQQAAPIPQVPESPAPNTQQAAPPVQQAPTPPPAASQPQVQAPVPPQQPVQTSSKQYTPDELAKAAISLMDAGRQNDLLGLLAQFGVEAIPQLHPDQYGAFATALRGLGAQI